MVLSSLEDAHGLGCAAGIGDDGRHHGASYRPASRKGNHVGIGAEEGAVRERAPQRTASARGGCGRIETERPAVVVEHQPHLRCHGSPEASPGVEDAGAIVGELLYQNRVPAIGEDVPGPAGELSRPFPPASPILDVLPLGRVHADQGGLPVENRDPAVPKHDRPGDLPEQVSLVSGHPADNHTRRAGDSPAISVPRGRTALDDLDSGAVLNDDGARPADPGVVRLAGDGEARQPREDDCGPAVVRQHGSSCCSPDRSSGHTCTVSTPSSSRTPTRK